MHEYSGVTDSMLAFHAGNQGTNPNIDKFFHEKMENIFIKLCLAKVVLRLSSANSNLYEYSGVMVSMFAFQAGGQGTITSSTFFFFSS